MAPGSPAPLAWITGAQGLIGNDLVQAASRYVPAFRVRGLTRDTVDLLDGTVVDGLFKREPPDLIIHCAAISRNPVCDADPKLAHRTNVGVTKHLADLASGIPFVFFSTDLVFDGTKGAYVEEDTPNPLSIYGETKVLAEQAVRQHPQHLVVRISLTGGLSRSGNRAFNEEMKNAWREGRSLTLFTDEYRCPCASPVIVRAVWELVATNARGTFHLCLPERLSRYEIGLALAAKHPELAPKIIPTSRAEYKGPPRPADTSMSTEKVEAVLSFPLPRFTDWLREDTTGF
jgi:dTDP-4-dehydrorhamnose reductase